MAPDWILVRCPRGFFIPGVVFESTQPPLYGERVDWLQFKPKGAYPTKRCLLVSPGLNGYI